MHSMLWITQMLSRTRQSLRTHPVAWTVALVLWTALPSFLLLRWWAGRSPECIALAHLSPPSPSSYYDQLRHRTRAWPPLYPPLSSSSWDMNVALKQPPTGFPALSHDSYVAQHTFMAVKVYKGVIYVNWDPREPQDAGRAFYWMSREVMLEQLLTAIWLYKDFPDVDLLLNYLDVPVGSTLTEPLMPFLEFASINTTSSVTGQPLDVAPAYVVNSPYTKEWCAGYSQGFAVPTPDTWIDMGISPGQLQDYSYCVWKRAGLDTAGYYRNNNGQPVQGLKGKDAFLEMAYQLGWTSKRAPTAYWRGSATGGLGGWPPQVMSKFRCRPADQLQHPTGDDFLRLNKRSRVAMMSRDYPWIDARLTLMQGEVNATVEQHLHDLGVMSGWDNIQSWTRKQLTLSFDGHGPPFRLPRQLLGMTPVLRMESVVRVPEQMNEFCLTHHALQEWLDIHLEPSVHYEPIASDLHDLTNKTFALLKEAANDSRRLQTMAIAARDLVVERVHLLAQLDSVMWSVLKLKQVLAYEVQPPTGGKPWTWGAERGWMPLKLKRDRRWFGASLHKVKERIMQDCASNFQ